MKFCFGDIVVVEDNLIGVVVKDWCPSPSSKREPYHEVYVRYFNDIREYNESQMERYMVRHKYLSDEEIVWQNNAVHNNQSEFDDICTNIVKALLSNNPMNVQNKNVVSETGDLLERRKQVEKEIQAEIKPMLEEYMCYVGDTDKKAVTRICNCLKFADIGTLDKLINTHPVDLRKIRNMGNATRELLVSALLYYCSTHNIKAKYTASDYSVLL